MTATPDDPRQSDTTNGVFASRRRLLKGLASDNGAAAVIVYGDAYSAGPIRYLAGFTPRREAYLCIAEGALDTLFIQFFNHVPNAGRTASVPAVEWGGPSSPATVARHLRKLPSFPDSVALVGSISHQAYQQLAEELAEVELVDLSATFWRGRLVKDLTEIALTRRGAALTDDALDHLVASVVPGVTERELGAAVTSFCTLRGGHIGICFLMVTSMDGEGRYVPAQQWSDRAAQPGDMVVLELSAGYAGHTGQILRTVTLGEPTPTVTRLHGVAVEAFSEISSLVQPGTRSSELLEAARIIDQHGFTVCDDVIHGYGGGYLDPVLRTPATQHAPYAELELQPGMMVVVQPNVVTFDHSVGVQTGELLLVTEDGHESLHQFPRGLVAA